jgi:hypothetical protein
MLHVVGSVMVGSLWPKCQEPGVDYSRCVRLASKKPGDVKHVDAIATVACYDARSKKWAGGEDCQRRRGLRLAKSSDPNALRPLVEACNGKVTAVGLQPGEGKDSFVLSPFDAKHRVQQPSPSPSPTAELQALIVATSKEALDRSSLKLQPYPVELDGDGRLDQVIVVTARTLAKGRLANLTAVLAAEPTKPFGFNERDPTDHYGLWIDAIMDVDSDGRFEILVVESDQGLRSSLWRLEGSEMVELGVVDCLS